MTDCHVECTEWGYSLSRLANISLYRFGTVLTQACSTNARTLLTTSEGWPVCLLLSRVVPPQNTQERGYILAFSHFVFKSMTFVKDDLDMKHENANIDTTDLHWICATNAKKLEFKTVARWTKPKNGMLSYFVHRLPTGYGNQYVIL